MYLWNEIREFILETLFRNPLSAKEIIRRVKDEFHLGCSQANIYRHLQDLIIENKIILNKQHYFPTLRFIHKQIENSNILQKNIFKALEIEISEELKKDWYIRREFNSFIDCQNFIRNIGIVEHLIRSQYVHEYVVLKHLVYSFFPQWKNFTKGRSKNKNFDLSWLLLNQSILDKIDFKDFNNHWFNLEFTNNNFELEKWEKYTQYYILANKITKIKFPWEKYLEEHYKISDSCENWIINKKAYNFFCWKFSQKEKKELGNTKVILEIEINGKKANEFIKKIKEEMEKVKKQR